MSEAVEMPEVDDFDPAKFRYFFANPGDNEPFLYATVTALLYDGRTIIKCQIDQTTGKIQIPERHLYNNKHGIETYAMAMEDGNRRNLVSCFMVGLGHPVNEPVLLSQRQGQSLEYRSFEGTTIKHESIAQVVEYSTPECVVIPFDRRDSEMRDGLQRLGVRTNPMNRDNSNRYDVYRVTQAEKHGVFALHCLYLVTLDDGRSFHLYHQKREEFKVYKRSPQKRFKLQTHDPRVHRLHKNSRPIRDFMDKFVFVPSPGFVSIESRLSALEDQGLRDLVESLPDLSIWEEVDNSSSPLKRLPKYWGRIKFLTLGLGNGSYGIIELDEPIEVGGHPHRSLQFAHDCVVDGDAFRDSQEIYYFPPGTEVEVPESDIISTGFHSGQIPFKPYPPMARKVRVVSE